MLTVSNPLSFRPPFSAILSRFPYSFNLLTILALFFYLLLFLHTWFFFSLLHSIFFFLYYLWLSGFLILSYYSIAFFSLLYLFHSPSIFLSFFLSNSFFSLFSHSLKPSLSADSLLNLLVSHPREHRQNLPWAWLAVADLQLTVLRCLPATARESVSSQEKRVRTRPARRATVWTRTACRQEEKEEKHLLQFPLSNKQNSTPSSYSLLLRKTKGKSHSRKQLAHFAPYLIRPCYAPWTARVRRILYVFWVGLRPFSAQFQV